MRVCVVPFFIFPSPAKVGVHVFVLAQTYVDIASLGQLCRTTGGQLYHYGKFDARSDTAQLFNDLRWSLIRPQARSDPSPLKPYRSMSISMLVVCTACVLVNGQCMCTSQRPMHVWPTSLQN